MKQEKPLLIITSCTRNYGWVTRAFLEGNTRWADYIIVVDQMSTDGTREMCAEYQNVVLVDDPDMTYKESTRAKVAFMKGRELAAGRDAIYFALDIDEVMPANWMNTADGGRILTSKPGDMFQLEWANILPGGEICNRNGWQYKIFHDDGIKWQDTGSQLHTPLLPYSSWSENAINSVHDFPLLHFGVYNTLWNNYKQVFYQFIDIQQHRSHSAISIYRKYHPAETKKLPTQIIKSEWLYDDVDLIGLVDITSQPIFVQYIRETINKEGITKFQAIDVWTKELCEAVNEKDPRSFGWKCLHLYLRLTNRISRSLVIRGLDKILKKMV